MMALPKKSLNCYKILSSASLQGLKKTFWAKPFMITSILAWLSVQKETRPQARLFSRNTSLADFCKAPDRSLAQKGG
jgi:hypothetical protein